MSLQLALEPVDMDSHLPSNRNESWTDEKHVHFLNSMEACFVRTMLENNGRYNQRLDRHLPDSSESTLDCKHYIQTRKKHATSGNLNVLVIDLVLFLFMVHFSNSLWRFQGFVLSCFDHGSIFHGAKWCILA